MNRELCGIYIRVKRDGKWDNICFSDLTDKEMDEFLATKDKKWVDSLAKQLARCLHEIGDEFDIISQYGDHKTLQVGYYDE